jgi:hypothetical protein
MLATAAGALVVLVATSGPAVPANGDAPPAMPEEPLPLGSAVPPPVPIPEVAPRGRPVPMPHVEPRGLPPVPMPHAQPGLSQR